MILTLMFEGQSLGFVEFWPRTGGAPNGSLRPNANYQAARPAIQSVTSDLPQEPEQIRDHVRARLAALYARGLGLYTPAGKLMPTSTLVVGDAAPLEYDLADFPDWRVPVSAEFVTPPDFGST